MKFWEMENEIKNGKLRNAYLIYGDDEGYISSLVRNIRKLSGVSEDDVFNFLRIDGQKAEYTELMSAVSTLPVMSDRKYVEVFRADFISGSRAIKDSSEKISLIKDIFENPPEDMVIVVYYLLGEGTDKAEEQIKKIEKKADSKKAVVQKLPSMVKDITKNNSVRKELINNTAMRIFSERKIVMPKFVVPYLRDFFDSSIDVLENDLIKILNYAGDRPVVKEDFEKLMTKSGSMHIFNLRDLIISGRTKDAIELYHELLPKMKNPIELLGILGNALREIYNFKVVVAQSKDNEEIMKKSGINQEWRLNNKLEEVRNISFDRLNKMLSYLIEGELRLKGISSNPEADMELIIMMISSSK